MTESKLLSTYVAYRGILYQMCDHGGRISVRKINALAHRISPHSLGYAALCAH